MNSHEAYLRKQAVAVESVHGKGYAHDLLAAADEIGRLSARVELLDRTLTTPGADNLLPGGGADTFADELETLALGLKKDGMVAGHSPQLWIGVLRYKAEAIRHAATGD